jgi:hypothetical protein
MAIKLLGENETEFSAEGIKPSVLSDGCKVSQSNTFKQISSLQHYKHDPTDTHCNI